MRGKARSLRADHHGHEEVAKHGGDRGDEEEEDHHHAVHGEELVVGVGLDEVAGGGEQFETDEQGEESADEEEERDGEQVEQGDALVVGGEQPRADTVVLVEIILALYGLNGCGCHTHSPDFLWLGPSGLRLAATPCDVDLCPGLGNGLRQRFHIGHQCVQLFFTDQSLERGHDGLESLHDFRPGIEDRFANVIFVCGDGTSVFELHRLAENSL